MSTIKFDPNFVSEKELMRNFDALVETLRPGLEARAHAKALRLNMDKVKRLSTAYLAMQKMTKGTDAVVTYNLGQPHMLVGGVEVRGSVLEFKNPEWFASIAALADNTEVYPLTNGGVYLSFGFCHLATPVYDAEEE